MGEYTLGLAADAAGVYIFYYDNWNLENSPEGEKGLAGQPFEIYDRIYIPKEILQNHFPHINFSNLRNSTSLK